MTPNISNILDKIIQELEDFRHSSYPLAHSTTTYITPDHPYAIQMLAEEKERAEARKVANPAIDKVWERIKRNQMFGIFREACSK